MFRLAWQCGYPHPRPMLETIDAEEFGEVLAMLQIEPLPDARADMRSARQTWATLQVNSRRPLRERDYLLTYNRPGPTKVDQAEYQRKSMLRYQRHNSAIERRRARG